MDDAVIVDSHTHLLPGRLGDKVRSAFAPVEDDLVYPTDHGRVRSALAAEGVAEIWTLPYAHKPGVASWLNHETHLIARTSGPLTVVPGATVHPGDDDPFEIVRTAVEELGARVLKLHCSVGDFPADDPRLDGVWRYVSLVHLPVVIHVGHAADGKTASHELAPVERTAARHPDAVIVVAHCGYPAVEETLALLDRHRNVHADLTPVVWDVPGPTPDQLASFADRILFGSDAPNVAVRASDGLQRLERSGLDEASLRLITGGNARRLSANVAS